MKDAIAILLIVACLALGAAVVIAITDSPSNYVEKRK